MEITIPFIHMHGTWSYNALTRKIGISSFTKDTNVFMPEGSIYIGIGSSDIWAPALNPTLNA